MPLKHKIAVCTGFFLLFLPWSLDGLYRWPSGEPALLLTAGVLGFLNALIALGFHSVLAPAFGRKPFLLLLPAWVLAAAPVWLWPPFSFPIYHFLCIWALGILVREITGRFFGEALPAAPARLTGALIVLVTFLRVTSHFSSAEHFTATAQAAMTPPVITFLITAVTLGFMAQRKPWQFFVLPTARFCLTLFLIASAAGMTALLGLDALKTDTEFRPRQRFRQPIPRYQLRPHLDRIDAFPEELQGQIAASGALVRFLHERQQALSREQIENIFQGAPLPPSQMLRAMQVYGLLQADSLGFHVPSAAFTVDLSEVLQDEYLPWVERFREAFALRREDFDPDLFQEAVRRRIIIRVAPRDLRFRLSANYRGPLSNGLLPRQILTLLYADPGQVWSIRDYGNQWDIPLLREAGPELEQLAEMGFLIPRRIHSGNFQYVRLFPARFPLKQSVSLAMASAGLLALFPLWFGGGKRRSALFLLAVPVLFTPLFFGLTGFEQSHPGYDAALRLLALPVWLVTVPRLAVLLRVEEERPQKAA